jgi:hypothetical protein
MPARTAVQVQVDPVQIGPAGTVIGMRINAWRGMVDRTCVIMDAEKDLRIVEQPGIGYLKENEKEKETQKIAKEIEIETAGETDTATEKENVIAIKNGIEKEIGMENATGTVIGIVTEETTRTEMGGKNESLRLVLRMLPPIQIQRTAI